MSNIPPEDLRIINNTIGLGTTDRRKARFFVHMAIDTELSTPASKGVPANIVKKPVDYVEVWHDNMKGESKSAPVQDWHKERFAAEWAAFQESRHEDIREERQPVRAAEAGQHERAPRPDWTGGASSVQAFDYSFDLTG